MTPEQWMNQYVGQSIDGGECVAWASFYSKNFLNVPVDIGNHNACDIFDAATEDYFDKIENTPDGVPQEGDIVVWHGWGSNPYGHIAVCSYTADVDSFISYDQNWPLGSNVHRQNHDYGNVRGWLRAKNRPWLTPTPEPTPEPTPAPAPTPEPTPVVEPTPEPESPVETPTPDTVTPPEFTVTPVPESTPPESTPPESTPKESKETKYNVFVTILNVLKGLDMAFLKSKKLLVTAIAGAIVSFASAYGQGELAKNILILVVPYLLGQSAVDIFKS
jgi:hypothetical protein